MNSIVLLSGPVGAGKTTVAWELVSLSPAPVAYIEGDVFWSFIVKSEKGRTLQKNFGTIMASMVAAALPYALAGYEVIVDFSIPPWFLERALKVVKSRCPVDYVVLRPSETVCAARAAARDEGKILDYGMYRDLYLSFDEAGPSSFCESDGDPGHVATRIRSGLDAGIFRISS